ncbi:MAG: four helix bundle protein [Algisphaera sp.]
MDGKGYRGLHVWERAMEAAEATYKLTAQMPRDEQYGLISQMRRSAVSIASNIAEGYGRKSTGDYLKHLAYARGSLAELETQITLAVRVGCIERKDAMTSWDLCQEVGKMLTRLVQSLETSPKKPKL